MGIAVRRLDRDRAKLPADPAIFTTDALGLVKRDDVDVVVEVVGGIEPARTWLVEALRRGKSVVTANKALLAEDSGALHDAAAEGGADLYFEAAVAGAIPLLRPLRQSLRGPDHQGDRDRQRHHQLHPLRHGRQRDGLRRGAGGGDRAGLRRGRPDRRRGGLRRGGQGRDPCLPCLPHPGTGRRRLPRRHHRGERRGCGPCQGDGLHHQAALPGGAHRRRGLGAGTPGDDPAYPPAGQRGRRLQRGLRRGTGRR